MEKSKEAVEEVVMSLLAKLFEVEDEEVGAPLLVRAAVDSEGHQLVVWLMRCLDHIPAYQQQLLAITESHGHQIKRHPLGCIVMKAQAGWL